MASVLVVGPPRSGTTWIARALAASDGARYVHEPDGDNEPFALRAKRNGPRYPVLTPGDDAPDLERLWRAALAGGEPTRHPAGRLARYLFERTPPAVRREARRGARPGWRLRMSLRLARPLDVDEARPPSVVVAKSVHASLCVEWIAERFAPRVLLVQRSPLDVLASWDELGIGLDPVEYEHLGRVAASRFGVTVPAASAPRVERQAGFLGTLLAAQRVAAAANPGWVTVDHETMVADPQAELRRLAAALGVPIDAGATAFLECSNAPGEGYATQRVAADLHERWRRRFSDDDAAAALAVLARFAVSGVG